MADDYQIQRAFQNLGTLYAAEHHEGDDEGVQQVQGMVALLRRFKKHEDDEHAAEPQPVREARFELSDGRAVYYDDGKESLRDAADLYEVLPELDGKGSPHLENLQARHLMDRIQTGVGLGSEQIGTLRKLMNKHKKAIQGLRANRDKHPDWLEVAPATSESTIIKQGETF